jgi:hypothetical protein
VKSSSSAGANKQDDTKHAISGSISAASYSNFSNSEGADNQRFRYTLSLNAENIAGSRFSAETYMSFRHKYGEGAEVRQNIFNALKIYSLGIKYDIDSSLHLGLGRQFNQRIASIGSFDGLKVEKSFKKFTMGLVGGTRPDYLNYGFDPGLLQYGGYVAYDKANERNYSSSSLAFMEQLNAGKTDRRFIYFQHSGSLMKKVNLFSSFEIDLFRLSDNKPVTKTDLTSLYISVNYRMLSNFSIGGSYDARKNPVYYETFKTLFDSLAVNELRQSYRLQTSLRVTKSLTFGLQSSWRYLKADPRQSKYLSGYLTYSMSSQNYFSATLTGNYIETGYIRGFNGGISLLKNFASGKLQAGAGYNYQDYSLPESNQNIIQHTATADLYWQLMPKMFVSMNYEAALEKKDVFNRIYFQVMKRF